MSNQALSFIGRLDKREEAFIMSEQQERAFLERLAGNRRSRLRNCTAPRPCAMCTYRPAPQTMPKN